MARKKVVSRSDEESPPLNSTNSVPVNNFRVVVRYADCRRNLAAREGGYVVDGCLEYIPTQVAEGNDGGALTCAGCGCHRNFHRVVVESEVAV